MDRRSVMAGGLALGMGLASAASAAAKSLALLIGTYSDEAGKGMQYVRYDPATDGFTRLDTFGAIENASFGVYDAARRRLYVTDERDVGRIAGYSLDKGRATPINSADSMAGAPCYLAFSPDRSHLAVANYHGDIAAVYALNRQTGAIEGAPQLLRADGPKEKGHAHWVQWSPDGRFIYVVDLGYDEVRAYPYDAKTGRAGAGMTAFKVAEKSGPRHMAFAPKAPYAFVLSEYSNELFALKREADGRLTEIQRVSILPTDFTGESFGAHIVVNARGDRVYVSNRGHNSLAVFAIARDGRLTHLQTIATGGNWPRFFKLFDAEKRLLVAHQRDHAITVFHVQRDGTLKETGKRFASHLPVYIEAI